MSETLESLGNRINSQRHELAELNAALHRKNIELDALHHVWCDGGCGGGMHRFENHPPLTEEMLLAAERSVARMRRWLTNAEFRKRYQVDAQFRADYWKRHADDEKAAPAFVAEWRAATATAQAERAVLDAAKAWVAFERRAWNPPRQPEHMASVDRDMLAAVAALDEGSK